MVFAVFFATACDSNAPARIESHEMKRVKDTVLLYDVLLADGHRNLNMNPLVQAATEDQAQKAYHYMSALGEGGVKMDSTLKDIQFVDITVTSPNTAKVSTIELWDYTYIKIDSDRQVYDNTVTYKLHYSLIRKDDKWLVSDITVESSEEKKADKFEPFYGPAKDPARGKVTEQKPQ